jgi:hypothetical protein
MIGRFPFGTQTPIRRLALWNEVAAIVRAQDWDALGWDEEEDERARLWQRAAEREDEDSLLRRLTAVTDARAPEIHQAAKSAAAAAGGADTAVIDVAAEAALMALHQNALTAIAGEDPDHYFFRKYNLFRRGRWPIGLYRGAFYVF